MFRTECCLVTGLLLSSSCASPALRARAVPALCQMPSGTQGSFTFFMKISCAYGLRVWGCACMCNVRCPGQSCQFSGLVIVSSNPTERWIFSLLAVVSVLVELVSCWEAKPGIQWPLGGAPALSKKKHTKDSTVLILVMQIGTALRRKL